MALVLGDNFSYQGSKPLDARLKYSTLADMKAVADATMYDGCMAYCVATDKTYQWKSTNEVDADTGRWREFSSGGGGSSYTAGDGIDITDDVISTKQSEEGDIDEIIDVYPTAGNLVSIVNAFNKGDIYSTGEKMIGQWINGKPIYQKVIETTVPSAGSDTVISMSSLSWEHVISVKGIENAFDTTPTFNQYMGSRNNDDSRIQVFVNNADGGNLYVRNINYNNSAGHTIYVILQYTKTTDTAISIGEETEYSTDEKIVGTWIDGKPIYQKTITGISPSNAGSVGDTTNAQSYSLGANIESLIKVQGQLHRISGGYHLSYEIGTQYLDNNQFFKMWFRLNDSPENANTVAICVGSDWVNSPFYLTIQYTKTTT